MSVDKVTAIFSDHRELFSQTALDDVCSSYLERLNIIEIDDTKYPLLEDYRKRLEINFVDAITKFLERFLASRERISRELLDGREITKVERLIIKSKPIRHGQTVMKLETNAGNFYYKPHNCDVDLLYGEIVARYFSDCTLTPKLTAESEYAFMSEIIPHALSSDKEAEDYFYNFGVLTALCLGLGIGDVTCANIMPCGKFPVIVDTEVFLRGETPARDFDERTLTLNNDYYYSVVRTSIMPVHYYLRSVSSPLYITLHGTEHLPYCRDENFFTVEGKDSFSEGCIKHRDEVIAQTVDESYRRMLEHKEGVIFFTIEGREEYFLNGFSEGYKRMLEHREDIMRICGLHEDLPVRHIMNSSVYYFVIMQALLQPSSMLSNYAKMQVLNKLYLGIDPNEREADAENIVNYESKCLTELDIPYFCVKLGEKSLYGSDTSEIVNADYFSQSPLDVLKMRLNRLSEKEYRFERDCIKSIFSQLTFDAETPGSFKILGNIISQQNILDAIKNIWANLNEHVIHGTDNLPLWHSPALIIEDFEKSQSYTSWAGVVLFCSALKGCEDFTEFHDAEKLYDTCLKALDMQINHWQNINAERLQNKIPMSLYAGLGGVALALALSSSKVSLEKFLHLISDKKLLDTKRFNIADLIMPMLMMKDKAIYSSRLLDELIAYGSEKIYQQNIDNSSQQFDVITKLGAALAKIYRLTGEKKFAVKSEKIFGALKESYSESLTGWPDGKILWLAKKSPLSGCIAYYSIEALDSMSNSQVINDVAELALKSICVNENLLYRDSIYRGNSASVLSLLKAHEKFSRPYYLEKAEQIISSMLERYYQSKTFIIMPEGINSCFDPSFFYGTLGIGRVLALFLNQKG